jgi:hypothetical protein
LFNNKIIFNSVKFVATKKIRQQIFSPSFFVALVGSGIRGDKNQDPDPGTGINIPDPKHCYLLILYFP